MPQGKASQYDLTIILFLGLVWGSTCNLIINRTEFKLYWMYSVFFHKKIRTLAIAGILVPLGFHPNHSGSSNLASSLCYTHYWSYRPTAHFHFKEFLGSTNVNYLCWTNVTPGAGKIMVDCEFGFLGFSWRRVKSWKSCRTIAKCSLNKVKVIHTIEKSIIHPKTEKKKAPS